MRSRALPRNALLAFLSLALLLSTITATPARAATTGQDSGVAAAWTTTPVTVDAAGQLVADLRWTGAGTDLNLGLRNPAGQWVTWAALAHHTQHETVTAAVTPGQWVLGIAVAKGPADYTLDWVIAPTAVETSTPFSPTGQQSGVATTWETATVDVTESGPLQAELTWLETTADLNLGLRSPDGTWVTWETEGHADRRESITHDATPGRWTLGVAVRSGSGTYSLQWAVGAASTSTETVIEPEEPIVEDTPVIEPEDPIVEETPVAASTPRRRGFAVEQESPIHRYTTAQAVDHATRYDVITALRNSYAGHVPAMREANPDLELYVYYNGVFAQRDQKSTYPESWYARDANGQKIQNDWGLWMMDVSHPSWVDERVRTCQAFIGESGFDGCFIDNLGWGTLWPASLSAQPINPATRQAWTNSDWMRATSAISAEARRRAAPAPIMANGLVSGHHFFHPQAPTAGLLNSSDSALAESWLRPPGQPANQFRPMAAWRADVDMLAWAAQADQRVFVTAKLWVTATAAQVEQHHLYALTSFMLGDGGRHGFSFSPARHSELYSHEWWDVDLGAPKGAYTESGGLFSRSFDRGQVHVNPSTQTKVVQLTTPHRDPHGNLVTSVELPPNTGTFLQLAP